MNKNFISVTLNSKTYYAYKDDPEKLKLAALDSNDYKRFIIYNKEIFKSDQAVEILNNLNYIEIDNWIKEYYQVDITQRQVKVCITLARNQKHLGKFFCEIQKRIKNKKFECLNPDKDDPKSLTKENLELHQQKLANAFYPETIVQDFLSFFHLTLE